MQQGSCLTLSSKRRRALQVATCRGHAPLACPPGHPMQAEGQEQVWGTSADSYRRATLRSSGIKEWRLGMRCTKYGRQATMGHLPFRHPEAYRGSTTAFKQQQHCNCTAAAQNSGCSKHPLLSLAAVA